MRTGILVVSVLALATAVLPGMGPALALDQRNVRVYVPHPDADTVSVIDGDTNSRSGPHRGSSRSPLTGSRCT